MLTRLPQLTLLLAGVLILTLMVACGRSAVGPPATIVRGSTPFIPTLSNPAIAMTMTATGPYLFITVQPDGRISGVGRLGSGVELTLVPESMTPSPNVTRGPVPTHPPGPSDLANQRATPGTPPPVTLAPPSTARSLPPTYTPSPTP